MTTYPQSFLAVFFLTVSIMSLVSIDSLQAQEVDVRAGATDVEVDREGVAVDVNSPQQNPITDRPMDFQIAAWLLIDQRSIIDLAEYGSKHSQSPEVRKLAEAIIRDHQSLAQTLSEIGQATTQPRSNILRDRGQRAEAAEDRIDQRADTQREEAAAAPRDGARRPPASIVDRVEDGIERVADRAEQLLETGRDAVDRELTPERAVRSSARSPWIEIHRQIASNLSQAARQDLDQRQGYELDASLVGMFVASHLQQEATMEVLATRASPDLQSTLKQAADTIRQHRQHAEKVMNTIKR